MKNKKAKTSEPRRRGGLYLVERREFRKIARRLRPESHAGAVLLAMVKQKKPVTSAQIRREVARQGKIETRMQLERAVSWELNKLKKIGLVRRVA